MAAQPLVRYSYRHPIETYATNVMGTVHLLEAIRQVGTSRWLSTSQQTSATKIVSGYGVIVKMSLWGA
jgi:nucleoside-diphosphate-sugar epimerase